MKQSLEVNFSYYIMYFAQAGQEIKLYQVSLQANVITHRNQNKIIV